HQNWGNYAYYPNTGAGAEPDEVMEGFIGQFYVKRQPPALVLISNPVMNADLVVEMLSGKLGRKVRLVVPQRGEKAMLVEGVLRNARESLNRRIFEISNQRRLLEEAAEIFDLGIVPDRVEVIDNSHIQGAYSMGALIAVGSEGYLKSAYRKYTIRNDEAGIDRNADDYAMVRQVLTRRYGRLVKEDPDRLSDAWPDLVIIDGGRGQLNAAFEVLNEIGLSDMQLIAISKGPNRNHGKETFHMMDRESFTLSDDHPVLYFMQRLRDEAHRFAIGAHRSRRGKTMSASALVEIPGVGAARRSALLAHFGSFRAVKNAAVEDLQAVRGVSLALATTIHAHLNE
ncbi:MAG: helix-hairpin-helix domain-containing protein, partial [Rhodobacteraceae bacterium]|nr:helix-hairpin-helix domain-containing protein [Paracoccaceae bacterium]